MLIPLAAGALPGNASATEGSGGFEAASLALLGLEVLVLLVLGALAWSLVRRGRARVTEFHRRAAWQWARKGLQIPLWLLIVFSVVEVVEWRVLIAGITLRAALLLLALPVLFALLTPAPRSPRERTAARWSRAARP